MYLALKEIVYMIEHRRAFIIGILEEARNAANKHGYFSAAEVSNVQMCACLLWDLSIAMSRKPNRGEKKASSFTISPEMKVFLENAYAAGDLTA